MFNAVILLTWQLSSAVTDDINLRIAVSHQCRFHGNVNQSLGCQGKPHVLCGVGMSRLWIDVGRHVLSVAAFRVIHCVDLNEREDTSRSPAVLYN